MRFNDALSGAIFILLAIALVSTAATYPVLPGQPYGASLFPTVVGAGFAICGLFLVVRGLSAVGRRQPALELDVLLRTPRNAVSILLIVGAVLLYILLAEWIGFIPVAFALLTALFLWFGVRLHNALIIAILFTAVTFWFFANMLRVPLPRGWLTGII
jgi:putative tricarboxylic transport membrane protein